MLLGSCLLHEKSKSGYPTRRDLMRATFLLQVESCKTIFKPDQSGPGQNLGFFFSSVISSAFCTLTTIRATVSDVDCSIPRDLYLVVSEPLISTCKWNSVHSLRHPGEQSNSPPLSYTDYHVSSFLPGVPRPLSPTDIWAILCVPPFPAFSIPSGRKENMFATYFENKWSIIADVQFSLVVLYERIRVLYLLSYRAVQSFLEALVWFELHSACLRIYRAKSHVLWVVGMNDALEAIFDLQQGPAFQKHWNRDVEFSAQMHIFSSSSQLFSVILLKKRKRDLNVWANFLEMLVQTSMRKQLVKTRL